MKRSSNGFSLVEVTLALLIIGILSAIAVPLLMGQKRNAELVGDAQQNSKALQLMLETRKADTGLYGPANNFTIWRADGTVTGTNLAPLFAPRGGTHMDYTLTIGATGLDYDLTINDPRPGKGNATIYRTDQTGRQIYP